MADTTYHSIHKGTQIDSAVTEVLNNLAGIQGVKVDDTELTPDTENKVNIDTSTFNIPVVVQETGTSETDVMSQNAVTTAINAIDIPEVVQQTGTSIETVMSQNAVTNAIGDLVIPAVLQETGTSTTNVMSQDAVTDNLDLKVDKTSTGDLRRVYGVDPSNVQELTEIESTPTDSSTKLVTSGGIKSALDLKSPLASPTFTGVPTGIRQDFTATLPYASWTGSSAPYTKAVTVTGILETDNPDIDLDLSSTTYSDIATIQSGWANVYRGVTSADTITFYASTVPTIDIPLQIKVVR